VRAVTHPYPGAFCSVGGRKLLVWESSIAHEAGRRGAPGELVKVVSTAGGDAVEVAAGEGSLLIARAQFDGAAEGAAAEILCDVLSKGSRSGGVGTRARLE
jgi:methionyl-tRNA formyltransferase